MILLKLHLGASGREQASLLKRENVFEHIGENCGYEPRRLPAEPQLVSLGNNVNIATNVAILNHDILFNMINNMGYKKCKNIGEETVGNNVFIGGHSVILGDVVIGSNVITGAGNIVSKDVQDGVVVAGAPAKVIGSFDETVEKYIQHNPY